MRSVAPEAMDAVTPEPHELLRHLVRLWSHPDYQPPALPEAALRIIQLAQDEDVQIDQVVEALERDPVLAGHVLHLVRTPAYAGSQKVRSLRHGIVRLGLGRLRAAVIETALGMRIFRSSAYGGFMRALSAHARASAHIARATARRTTADPETAFLVALLHEIGLAGLVLTLVDGFPDARPTLGQLRAGLALRAPQAARRMLEAWGLAEHAPLVTFMGGQEPPETREEAVLVVTGHLAEALDFGHPPPFDEATDPERLDPALRLLGFDDRTLSEIKRAATPFLGGLRKRVAA